MQVGEQGVPVCMLSFLKVTIVRDCHVCYLTSCHGNVHIVLLVVCGVAAVCARIAERSLPSPRC